MKKLHKNLTLCLGLILCNHEVVQGKELFGIASYYTVSSSGNRTASGERLHNSRFTAAHKTLKFGTKVRVTNIKNGKSEIFTINDRGPFVKGRIIDVSRIGASRLGFLKSGVSKVKIEILD
jgi:rare lipoprotein A